MRLPIVVTEPEFVRPGTVFAAHATLTFAQTTSAVQGTEKGKAKGPLL